MKQPLGWRKKVPETNPGLANPPSSKRVSYLSGSLFSADLLIVDTHN